ncbi:hypothetical protein [Brunnivagina elsteri]|nr:hypothetical protein [Calothrix elsteri]
MLTPPTSHTKEVIRWQADVFWGMNQNNSTRFLLCDRTTYPSAS